MVNVFDTDIEPGLHGTVTAVINELEGTTNLEPVNIMKLANVDEPIVIFWSPLPEV